MELQRSSDVRILYSANVAMKKAIIPFATIERQEMQLITDPKNRTRMPWESPSLGSGGQIFFTKWEGTEVNMVTNGKFAETKVIKKLPMDENFKTVARIYGSLKGKDGSNEERYITHDCPLRDTDTKKWQCLLNTAKVIESKQVCDGNHDCCDEAGQCWDESDEAPERCKGTNNGMITISKCVNITCLVLGYLLTVVYFPVGASKTMWTRVNSNTKTKEDCNADLDHETFKSIFKICKRFEEWNNTNVGNPPSRVDLIDITEKYKSLHTAKDFEQIRAMNCCLKNLSLADSFKYTSMVIAEHLLSLEHEDLHVNDSSETGNRCVSGTMSGNLKVAEFVIQAKEQKDFLSRVKRSIKTALSIDFYTKVVILFTLLTTVCVFVIDTVMPYYDSHLDASLAIALDHIETFFITSDSKEKEISFVSLTITKYYYFLISILSTIFLSMNFFINLPVLKQNSESILFSGSEFGQTKLGKILSFFPIIFPYHFMALEYARLKYRTFKGIQEIQRLLHALKLKENLDNSTEDIDYFMKLQREVQEQSNYETELRRIIIASFMINLLVEGVPQFIVMSSLLMTELRSETGFGKLRPVFENVLKEYIGIPGKESFILMLCVQIFKIDFSLKTVLSSTMYGIGAGLVASIIKILELIFLVTAKLILLTLQLYQAPYLFALVTIVEFAIAYSYCKITQENVSLMQDVVPIAITPALHLVTKGNILRQKERDLKQNYACLLRWNGTLNVVVLHIVNLLLVYVPLKLALPSLLPNVQPDWGTGYICALVGYVLSLIPFLCLEIAFFKCGRRWKLLEVGPRSTNEKQEMEMTKDNVNDTKTTSSLEIPLQV